jgi:hypothetical protein
VIRNTWYHSSDIHFKKEGDKNIYISNKIGCHGNYDFKVTPLNKTLTGIKRKINASRDGVMECKVVYNPSAFKEVFCKYKPGMTYVRKNDMSIRIGDKDDDDSEY